MDHDMDGDGKVKCEEKCYLCDRPNDAFKHLHCKTDSDNPSIVLCIPCLAALAHSVRRLTRAYEGGGYLFDDYMRDRVKRHEKSGGLGSAVEAPEWLAQALREIFDQADDA